MRGILTHTESRVAIARPSSMILLKLHHITLSLAILSWPLKLTPSASPLKVIVVYSVRGVGVVVAAGAVVAVFSVLRHAVTNSRVRQHRAAAVIQCLIVGSF